LVCWVATITTMRPASVTTIARPVAGRVNKGEASARRGMALSGAAAKKARSARPRGLVGAR
jgi:hypothetical protein